MARKKSQLDAFRDHLKRLKEELEPVYLLHGEEVYLQDSFIKAVCESFEDRYGTDWEKYVYHAEDVPPATILNQLVTNSLFSEPKVMIIKEVTTLDESESGGKSALLEYIRHPGKDIVLILQKDDRRFRDAFSKEVKKHAECIETRVPWMREMDEWLRYFLTLEGMTASSQARSLLIDLAGESLQQLLNELRKIALYLPEDDRALTPDLLHEFVGDTRTHKVYEFGDLLGTKHISNILSHLFSLLEEGKSVSYIVTKAADFFITIWTLKQMEQEGKSQEEMNTLVFNGRNLAWKFRKVTKKFTQAEIQRALPLLEEADFLTKTSSNMLDAKNYLTAILLEIFNEPGPFHHE